VVASVNWSPNTITNSPQVVFFFIRDYPYDSYNIFFTSKSKCITSFTLSLRTKSMK